MNASTNTGSYGVSREEAESIIKRFLDNENYTVLAVNGEWGLGKTYLVQNFLSEYTKGYYYYASVFGISSIEQLKARILANYKHHVATSIQSKSQLILNYINKFLTNVFAWINRNYGRIEQTRNINFLFPGQSSISIVGSLISVVGDLVLNILFHEVAKNSIICIDDLERKSKLPLDELLGFVEYLVQEYKCKVILIYNEKILSEDEQSKKVLQDYQEKVIDIKFKLAPTVEENFKFIFKDNPDIEVIKQVFINAGTNNIRVIRKTKWLIDEFIPLIENWQPSLRNQVIINAIIISLATLDTEFCQRFSLSIDWILHLINTSKYSNYEPGEKEVQFIQQARQLGYIFLEIDEIIIKAIATSLSSSDELKWKKIGEKLNQKEKEKQIIEKISHLDKLYYNSFGNCEKEIEEEIITFMDNNCLDLNISQFEQIEKIASLMEINVSRYEKALLEKMLKNLEERELFDSFLFHYLNRKLERYPDLETEIENRKHEYQQELNITKAVKNLITNNGFLTSPTPGLKANIEFLNNRTVEEYAEWLQHGYPDLYLMVRHFLSMSLPASQKLEESIRSLAKNSKLNKIRAKYIYNIDIDNNSDNSDDS